jgi:NADH:ubiquinone oxidoreductase subunit K
MLENIPIEHYSFIALFMFFAGLYGFFTRTNLITMLMSIELILNSVNIHFVAFNKYLNADFLQGQIFSLFVIAVAAAEAAVAIAIIINVYRKLRDIEVKDVSTMKY